VVEQLQYHPVARDTYQIITRLLWFFASPSTLPRGIYFGDLPLEIPPTFPPGFSTASDLSFLATPPEEVNCTAKDLCILTWRENPSSYTLLLTTAVNPENGSWSQARGTVTDPVYGIFTLELYPNRTHSLNLSVPGSSPITLFTLSCEDGRCTLNASLRIPILLEGSFSPSFRHFSYTPSPLFSFPWRIAPQRVEVRWFTEGVTVHELFPSFAWVRTIYRDPLTLEETGFPGRDASWEPFGEGFRYRILLPEKGAIERIEHTFYASPYASSGTSVERRYPRLLSPVEIHFRWARTGRGTLQLHLSFDPYQGYFHFFEDPLGLMISGYLTTLFGDLITFQGRWFFFGLLLGEYAGYRPQSGERAQEEGRIQLLPDGSAQADLLFLQKDGTYAELRLVTPPEGFSASALQ
jgi:hypothetical protein